MTDTFDEEKLLLGIRETTRLLGEVDRPELRDELLFEVHMFLGRLELLRARALGREAELIRPKRIRENLYDYLREDLVDFLQKILSGKFQRDDFPDLQPLHRAIIKILKELGVYVFYPAGKDFERTTILERWYVGLNRLHPLTLRKVINYFELYTTRLYSLLDEAPVGYEDLRIVVQRMLASEHYDIPFNEIYEADIALREEIQFSLLRSISAERRLEYLVQKEIIAGLSNSFITILHEEYSVNYRQLLEEHRSRADALEQERDNLTSEVKIAGYMAQKQFQQKLPDGDPRIEFSLWYEPFMGVGGDYYRVMQLDKDEYAILIADIAGHGLGAAMYVNTLRVTFEDKSHYLHRPARMLKRMNEELYGKLGDNFVTAIYVYLNLKKGELRYCNAGHPKGFFYGRNENRRHVRFLRPNSKIIGVFQNIEFREARLPFSGSWRLVLYTDGIPETVNPRMEMLGERGLSLRMVDTDRLSAVETVDVIKGGVNEYRAGAPVEDDRTLLVTDLSGPGGAE